MYGGSPVLTSLLGTETRFFQYSEFRALKIFLIFFADSQTGLVLVVLLLISLTLLALVFARFQLSLTTVDIWLVPVHSLRLSGIVHLSFSLSRSYLLYMTYLFLESVSVFHAT